MKFKDVRQIYKEENGVDKPGWASRRFIGAAVLFGGVIIQAFFGVKLDSKILNTFADNFTTLTGTIQVLIPAIIQIYGFILSVIGAVKKSQSEGVC